MQIHTSFEEPHVKKREGIPALEGSFISWYRKAQQARLSREAA